MIDELFLYDKEKGFFKEILKQSSVMQGRYHVSPNYGHDLNTNNLDSFLKDDGYGLNKPEAKYPVCVCMTPQSKFVKLNSQKWELLFFQLYFLCTANQSNGTIKKIDRDTNTSGQHTWYDWSDMKQCGADFMEMVKEVIKKKIVGNIPLKSVANIDFENANVTRVTKVHNDSLNGVGVSFQAYLFTDACTMKDYNQSAIDNINFSSFIINH